MWQESFVPDGRYEKGVVCCFRRCPTVVYESLLEKQAVGAVERDAETIACKLPIVSGGNPFFECVKKFLKIKCSVFVKVFCKRILDSFVEGLERNVFDGRTSRNGYGIVSSVVGQWNQERRGEHFITMLDKSLGHEQVLVAEIFSF